MSLQIFKPIGFFISFYFLNVFFLDESLLGEGCKKVVLYELKSVMTEQITLYLL